MTQRAHGEGVPSLGKEMDFRWNTCLVQRSRIDYAIANRIDGIVPSLKKKCWRGHLGNFDTRIKRAPRSAQVARSEEHTSELQSLMRISYAVFCLKKQNNKYQSHTQVSI